MPAAWNGTVLLWSHGYRLPGKGLAPADASSELAAAWLLDHGDALAGSGYAHDGWAVGSALRDQMATLSALRHELGRRASHVRRVVAWGASMGGLITTSLVEEHPAQFAGGLSICGPLAGASAFWDRLLVFGESLQALIGPSSQLAQTVPARVPGDVARAEALVRRAQRSALGRARLALANAIVGVPGWYAPASAPPRSPLAQEVAQEHWDTQLLVPFDLGLRQALVTQAGGNPSSDTGVSMRRLFLASPERAEVEALYEAAGASLGVDLQRLARWPRVPAQPGPARYLAARSTPTGALLRPLVAMQGVGDGLVVPGNGLLLSQEARASGHGQMLRLLSVDGAGHCSYTTAEILTALRVELARVRSGHWGNLAPRQLDRLAARFGPRASLLDVVSLRGRSAAADAGRPSPPEPVPTPVAARFEVTPAALAGAWPGRGSPAPPTAGRRRRGERAGAPG